MDKVSLSLGVICWHWLLCALDLDILFVFLPEQIDDVFDHVVLTATLLSDPCHEHPLSNGHFLVKDRACFDLDDFLVTKHLLLFR